jgi:hypothetical protein
VEALTRPWLTDAGAASATHCRLPLKRAPQVTVFRMSAATGGLCDNCTRGHVLEGDPVGKWEEGFYVSRTARTEQGEEILTNSKKCLVLLTDAFGIPLVNNRLLADEMSRRCEMDVYVPDIFNGFYHAALFIYCL